MKLKKLIFLSLLGATAPGTIANEFDFDGDGLADLSVRRPTNGIQLIFNSSRTNIGSGNGSFVQRYAVGNRASDIPISGDFDGDGIADVGVRRADTFEWIIRYSSTGEQVTTVFGRGTEDIPVPADYDGDGVTDLAVRRPSTQYWYILNSSGVDEITFHDDAVTRVVFGRNADDTPVVKDYDGDGKADIAIWRPSNQFWYIKNSSGTDAITNNDDGITRLKFGEFATDIPVPNDYNADDKADIAVRRPSNYTWYIRNSDNSNFNSDAQDGIQRIVFGKNEADIPIVADYDGDGIADLAVQRSSNQHFYIRNSSGENINSDTQNGIQRINQGAIFGFDESDIAVNANESHRFTEASGIVNTVTHRVIHEVDWPQESMSAGKRFIVIRDQSIYEHELTLRSDDSPSVINFGKESVVLLDSGLRNSGGYRIGITTATEYAEHVELQVETIVPGFYCGVTLALTQPVKFYQFNTTKEIVIKESRRVTSCERPF